MPQVAPAVSSFITVPLVILAVVVIIRGLWRATSVQKGTGCPVCDAHTGCGDDGHDHDHGHEHKH
jgi:hypothetical protein